MATQKLSKSSPLYFPLASESSRTFPLKLGKIPDYLQAHLKLLSKKPLEENLMNIIII